MYEREHAKPKDIRDFVGTYQQKDATYHHLHTKKDDLIDRKRAVDHRDVFETKHRHVGCIKTYLILGHYYWKH